MENTHSTQVRAETGSEKQLPKFSGFSHMSIPVRDNKEALRFFTEVLGAELVFDREGFAEVEICGIIVGFSPQKEGWTGFQSEFPHYAFFIEGDQFIPMKERLESYGVPTTQIWTRDGIRTLMYFRDPSGNLFEIYCPKGFKDAHKVPRGANAGGDYKINFGALNYDWKG